MCILGKSSILENNILPDGFICKTLFITLSLTIESPNSITESSLLIIVIMQCLFTLSSFHLVFWVPEILLNLVRVRPKHYQTISLEPIKNKKQTNKTKPYILLKRRHISHNLLLLLPPKLTLPLKYNSGKSTY